MSLSSTHRRSSGELCGWIFFFTLVWKSAFCQSITQTGCYIVCHAVVWLCRLWMQLGRSCCRSAICPQQSASQWSSPNARTWCGPTARPLQVRDSHSFAAVYVSFVNVCQRELHECPSVCLFSLVSSIFTFFKITQILPKDPFFSSRKADGS